MNREVTNEVLEALMREQLRANWLNTLLASATLALAGTIYASISSGTGWLLGNGIAIVAVLITVSSLVKIGQIDGDNWADRVGKRVPGWRDPLQRKVRILDQLKEADR